MVHTQANLVKRSAGHMLDVFFLLNTFLGFFLSYGQAENCPNLQAPVPSYLAILLHCLSLPLHLITLSGQGEPSLPQSTGTPRPFGRVLCRFITTIAFSPLSENTFPENSSERPSPPLLLPTFCSAREKVGAFSLPPEPSSESL